MSGVSETEHYRRLAFRLRHASQATATFGFLVLVDNGPDRCDKARSIIRVRDCWNLHRNRLEGN